MSVSYFVLDTQDDLDKALQSVARALARDFGSFPPFDGHVYNQAKTSNEVFPK